MNPKILHQEVQEFINTHLNEELSRVLFAKSPFQGISTRELAEQIESKKAAEKKLPIWFNAGNIYFPLKISIEQSSSELTAAYKSSLVRGKTLADLTGGFGVDSFFFSKKMESVVHCEINSELSAIARHNAAVLNIENIRFEVCNGIDFIRESREDFDTVYIDPSRRRDDKKVFFLSDCEPDVVSNLTLLLAKAQRIIIKTSPLLDIQSGLRDLKKVGQVHIVSVKNDCKELLWVIDRDNNNETDPEIICSALNGEGVQQFSFRFREEKELQLNEYAAPADYLYEPDVSLLKAGCFKTIAKRLGIFKLGVNTHLYTSEKLKKDFIGRIFRVISVENYKDFARKKGVVKANVISRNFPLKAEEIKKKHKIRDGGPAFLIFTSGPHGQLLAVHAERT